jgi:hypothetical protein
MPRWRSNISTVSDHRSVRVPTHAIPRTCMLASLWLERRARRPAQVPSLRSWSGRLHAVAATPAPVHRARDPLVQDILRQASVRWCAADICKGSRVSWPVAASKNLTLVGEPDRANTGAMPSESTSPGRWAS